MMIERANRLKVNPAEVHREMQVTLRRLQLPELPDNERQAILDSITLTQAQRFSLVEGGLVSVAPIIREAGISVIGEDHGFSAIVGILKQEGVPARYFEHINQKTGKVKRSGYISAYDGEKAFETLLTYPIFTERTR